MIATCFLQKIPSNLQLYKIILFIRKFNNIPHYKCHETTATPQSAERTSERKPLF
jgi:hypothetical protein